MMHFRLWRSASIFLLLHFLTFAVSTQSFAREKSEAFMVLFLGDHVKVVAPDKLNKESFVIIENKTLTKLIGRIEAPLGKIIHQVSIEPSKRASYSLKDASGERPFLVPLSPASQEVELIPGKDSYEIPAQN